MVADTISEAGISQLVGDVHEYQQFAFLIGAGTSKRAGIPTSRDLIDTWQQGRYEEVNPDIEFDGWIENVEPDEKPESWSAYGFWFEQQYPKRIHRRDQINKIVNASDPTMAHVLLALMMDEQYIPHILTPNFDDLLFHAFYRYTGHRPNLIDHRTVAPEFRLVSDDPTIVKLHGDYLYDNLKNTDSETETLRPAMKEVLQQTVSEYGLVVVGYSGGDNSIMDPLLDADLSEYGIYWCSLSSDSFDPKVKKLLERPNVHLIEIDGFESLMSRFGTELPDIEIPAPAEVVKRGKTQAERWASSLRKIVSQKETGTKKEAELREKVEKRWNSINLREDESYSESVELLNELIESYPDDAELYYQRGETKSSWGKHKEAIKDYNKAIKINPEYKTAYNNRGTSKFELDRFQEAIEDFTQALEQDSESRLALTNRAISKSHLNQYEEAFEDLNKALKLNTEHIESIHNRAEIGILIGEFDVAKNDAEKAQILSTSMGDKALSLLFDIIVCVIRDNNTEDKENRYRKICNKEPTLAWNFDQLDSWLNHADISSNKKEKIKELIKLLNSESDKQMV